MGGQGSGPSWLRVAWARRTRVSPGQAGLDRVSEPGTAHSRGPRAHLPSSSAHVRLRPPGPGSEGAPSEQESDMAETRHPSGGSRRPARAASPLAAARAASPLAAAGRARPLAAGCPATPLGGGRLAPRPSWLGRVAASLRAGESEGSAWRAEEAELGLEAPSRGTG